MNNLLLLGGAAVGALVLKRFVDSPWNKPGTKPDRVNRYNPVPIAPPPALPVGTRIVVEVGGLMAAPGYNVQAYAYALLVGFRDLANFIGSGAGTSWYNDRNLQQAVGLKAQGISWLLTLVQGIENGAKATAEFVVWHSADETDPLRFFYGSSLARQLELALLTKVPTVAPKVNFKVYNDQGQWRVEGDLETEKAEVTLGRLIQARVKYQVGQY